MKKSKKSGNKTLKAFNALLQKKQYLEFFTALLSIPVLITVIILNLNSLKNINKQAEPSNTPEKGGLFYSVPVETDEEDSPTPAGPCIKKLGPVEITSPKENQTTSQNPVYVTITYTDTDYCAAVWAYRINGGDWSDYDDRSLALYNLPQGNIKLELKAKSITAKDEKTYTRHFTYKGTTIIMPSAPVGSSSAN